jgi:YHS domain-containing protein
MRAKCRHCQTNLSTQDAYKTMFDKKRAYFCNEEHYNLFLEKKEKERIEKEFLKQKQKEEREAKNKKKQEEAAVETEKWKQTKNKAYYLICEIIGREEVINTLLWKEWATWNKVASNEVIGQYLEENKEYLISVIGRLDNIEYNRIKYLSAILKNKLGDYKPKAVIIEEEKPKVKVDESFYETSSTVRNNKRRSLADLEDEF